MLRKIALFSFIFAFISTDAQAGWKTDHARKIAEKVWKPQCKVKVKWEKPMPGYEDAYGWVVPGSCTVSLNPNYTHPWPTFCTLIAHEYGHVAGYKGNDPHDPEHDVPGSSSLMAHPMVTIEDWKKPLWVEFDTPYSKCAKYPRGYTEKDDPSSPLRRGH